MINPRWTWLGVAAWLACQSAAVQLVPRSDLEIPEMFGQQERQRADAEPVGLCRLQKDPPAYSRRKIEVSGIVSHGFESFTMSDAACPSAAVWLDYGGTINSNTVYCCGTRAGAQRAGTLIVEGITLPLLDDAMFRRFDARIRRSGEVRFRATVRGHFFAGEKQQPPGGSDYWGGYGHLGCCSLVVVQQVLARRWPGTSEGRAMVIARVVRGRLSSREELGE